VIDWAVARTRIGKHVLTNPHPTIEDRPLLGNRPVNTHHGNDFSTIEIVFYGVRAEELSLTQLTLQKSVEGSSVECSSSGNGSRIISLAKIRYQETSSEDPAEEL
jgi:hypothetical protein